MEFSDRELFARLLKCEAGGEGADGMKAVATTIMNRVNVAGGEYLRTGEGSLRKVIEQPFQYTCMLGEVYGEPNPQNVWASSPEQLQYDIADWALSGNKFGGCPEALWYYNPFAPNCAQYFPPNGSGYIFNRIGDHCFYNPTSAYYQT